MRPGYKTSEFWLAIAACVVGGVTAAGATSTGPVGQGVGVLVSALAAIGYSASRTWDKARTSSTGRPGYKTTEFWLTVGAVVVGGLVSSGAIPVESTPGKILALVGTVLAAMGYGIARGVGKSSA